MLFASNLRLLLVLLSLAVANQGIQSEASSSPLLHDSIERAKWATVGILRHSTESSYQTDQSKFAIRGSGVHLGDGYILTVRHAVERQQGGKSTIPQSIQLLTGSLLEVSATLIGVSRFLDVALYRVDQNRTEWDLVSVTFNQNEPHPGDEVFTVGYPLGWGPALSFGRLGNAQTFLPTAQSRLMQVDLSACSGNSGGGLFNTKGQIVGLIHAIIQTESNQTERQCSRFAFALPGRLIHKMVTSLKSGQSPRFPKLGIRMTVLKVDQQWRVAVAKAKGPARKAGLRKDDVLLSINGQDITSAAQLKSYLIEYTEPGQTITLRILRQNIERTVAVTLGKI